MRRRSSSSGVRFDRLPLDFSARSRTSRRSSGESRFQYFRPSVFNQRIAARTLRHGTFRTAVMACKTQVGIGVVVTTPRLERVTAPDSPPWREDERSRGRPEGTPVRTAGWLVARIAERRRYRARHTEQAHCPQCGDEFTRSAKSKRAQVFCSPWCMRSYRRADYKRRGIRPPGQPEAGKPGTVSTSGPAQSPRMR